MTAGLRIAVADDELEMREFFEKVLPRLGHQVVSVAANGKQLVEHCRDLKPDLVITDIKMPELDGIEACTQICRERVIPVILVSAYHDPALIERAEADHVQAYLVKPIGIADLPPAIAIAMRRFGELQRLQNDCNELRRALADRKVIDAGQSVLAVEKALAPHVPECGSSRDVVSPATTKQFEGPDDRK